MDQKRDKSEILLAWYDEHARLMPWRVPPAQRQLGVLPDPYHVWLSEVMLQQTTVAAVRDYFVKFTQMWPTVSDLAAADDGDVMAAWAGLGYYARARNLLKCARVVAHDLEGVFPDNEAALLKLPGIGPYTAAAVSAIAFDVPATVLDGNVERVMARQFAVMEPLPDSKEALRELAASRTPQNRAGDYAQAVMDLGATVCTPRSPHCGVCPWADGCVARAQGIAAELPKKRKKAKVPTRVGVVYVARRCDGAVLLEQRPDKGLLGGMMGWPGSDWAQTQIDHDQPLDANWRTLPETVRHTFTHFHLHLTVMVTNIPDDPPVFRGVFVDSERFDANALPTVMRKVWKQAQLALIETGSDR
ncbi:A/G-specific adenine glycosylase [Amylibacter ulvae]|uniref:Adenine DNA glycosylase n=1 Tax=Paramylibacter ulvae TaxID=1651968 RepID=A0ABQ3CW99_9RHOB|nr:A/G-specific adenine glycosylase [Amylibacter ulvae]GHA47051.1 A/G-specific adenine glycosylase [Amylibacter ulvae]